ncbi:hypothetical protein [Botrimarina mediterranea]|uniref:hypothetical protein n=1 Tax=Botrimarina mediterranea TaxID=2528022 RepID=UPI00118BDC8A|nr:hypothetical protein K2D_29930 [Planctomycetes bacterium K2D]
MKPLNIRDSLDRASATLERFDDWASWFGLRLLGGCITLGVVVGGLYAIAYQVESWRLASNFAAGMARFWEVYRDLWR